MRKDDASKFTISNMTDSRGTHEVCIRHTPMYASAFNFTVEELEELHTLLDDFLTQYHAECEHWCGIPVCNVDCGGSDCEVCMVDPHK